MIKQFFIAITAVMVLSAASPTFAGGNGGSWKKTKSCGFICKKLSKFKKHRKHKKRYGKPSHKAVPEIDAAGAAISLALLAGVVSIGRERRKRKLAK